MRPWLKIVLLLLLAGLGALWLVPGSDPAGAPVGGVAPPMVLPDLSGKEVALHALRGRAVVLNFWATWCPPCKEEMPALAEVWRGARGRCLEMVGVTEESTREDVRTEVDRLGIPFPVVMDDDGSVGRAYGITGYPRTYLVDAEGKVRKVFTGRVTREKLEGALAPLIPATCPEVR